MTPTIDNDAAALLLAADEAPAGEASEGVLPEDLLLLTAEAAFSKRTTEQLGYDDFLLYGLIDAGTARPIEVVHPNPDPEYAALIAQFESWARLPAAAYTGRLS